MPQEDEQSQSLVVAGNLGELVPQEEVVESDSGADDEPAKVQSFDFEVNKERELPVEAPVEVLPEQIIEDLASVEQPLVLRGSFSSNNKFSEGSSGDSAS